ncbi:hypothetical protein D9758_014769 [Tetrapyrgos nigripes]|uniref:pectate lyase n=1 Tax=Tetrapyrgos nigripes TaxID=182062 RepID=A0A8H5C532_9AGAR|nr:hypothetical protein D9758_014769 [Tetrapyrgos nigripes]
MFVSISLALALAALVAANPAPTIQKRTATNVWPKAPTTSSLSKAMTIAAGQTFTPSQAYTRYDRGSGACNGQTEGGDSDAVFLLEEGATLSRVIIGANQAEGVHCLGSCTLDHVYFEDVCEDAITIKQTSGTSRINYGGAKNADDKIVQHNGGGTVIINSFYAENFGKLYRSCGNCGTQYARHVEINDVWAVDGKTLVGINTYVSSLFNVIQSFNTTRTLDTSKIVITEILPRSALPGHRASAPSATNSPETATELSRLRQVVDLIVRLSLGCPRPSFWFSTPTFSLRDAALNTLFHLFSQSSLGFLHPFRFPVFVLAGRITNWFQSRLLPGKLPSCCSLPLRQYMAKYPRPDNLVDKKLADPLEWSNGVTWEWLGAANIGNVTTIQNTYVTPTRTVFELLAGPMVLNITFFSPIETQDLTKQSLPFTYLSFECQSRDGAQHEVEVYSDISAEWISGNRGNEAQWSTSTTPSSVIHGASRQSPQSMTEISNQAEDGTVYYAMQKVNGMTYQSGQDTDVRGQFRDHTDLLNTGDTNFRPINQNFVVFGIAVSLGSITSTSRPVVWGLGLVRDNVTNYPTASGDSVNRRPYFFSDPQFSSGNIQDVIDSFLLDYSNAVSRADALDAKIRNDATALSPNDSGQYYNLVAMAARQAMAGTEITFASDQDGGTNGTDVKSFMRNTGVDTSANNVPTLYSSFPAYLYLNASWGGYLLDALLQYQNSSAYTNQYAAPDLGSAYPQAAGDRSDTSQFSVEDTASMLIMVLAQARVTGDGTLIAKYYSLLKTWADYLVKNALHPQNQVISDNLSATVSDSTKLAMKGIIGIGAMSQISRAFGKNDDAQAYSVNASTFALQWKSLALGDSKIMARYGDSSSSALMYDLYADSLLQTGLFDSDPAGSSRRNGGLPIFHTRAPNILLLSYMNILARHLALLRRILSSACTDNILVLMFLAAALTKTDNSTRNQLISSVFARATFNGTGGGGNFPVTYDTQNGKMSDPSISAGQASPAQGAMFSLLALTLPNQAISVPDLSSTSSSKKVNAGTIAGAVVGGLAGVTILIAALVFFLRRRRRDVQQQRMLVEPRLSQRFSMAQNQQQPPTITPFMHQARLQRSCRRPYKVDLVGGAADYGSRENLGGGGSSSSEKRPFAPIRGANWGQVVQNNQSSNLSERSGPGSPTFSQSASSAPSSRYQQSQRSDATTQLRNEVDGLRREMEQLRAQAREYEPPPSYT